MPQPETTKDMNFPCAGIDQSDAFATQNPREVLPGLWSRSTPDGTNVRGYATQDRLRGGSRPMLASAILNPAVAGWVVQDLAVVVGTGYTQPAAGPSTVGLVYDAVEVLYAGAGVDYGED